jgi:phytoene dehydrogenase-like protein
LIKSQYDVVIIGAGHNGLVTACYLAKTGLNVLVLEKRYVVGGAAVTEEVFPGCRVSRLSYVSGIFQKKVLEDLRLNEYGLRILPRTPSSFSPFPDGRYLMLGPDRAFNVEQIGKFSQRDAEVFPRYEAMLDRLSQFIEPTLLEPPPDPQSVRIGDLMSMGKMALNARKLGDDIGTLWQVLSGSATHMLDNWFESEPLKTTLATDAIIGAFAAPSLPGTAYVLFHHVMGETNGVRGVWGYVQGGMGGLSESIAACARDLGVQIECNAGVSKIVVGSGGAQSVVLENGQEIAADVVVSSADANVTFMKLVGEEHLPDEFARAVREIRYDSASVKINLLLGELPRFTACDNGAGSGDGVGPEHRGTIHISPSREYIERAYDQAKYGQPSDSPVLECTIPSSVDDTIAPDGKYLMNMFVQYGPYDLKIDGTGSRYAPKDGSPATWDNIKESFGKRCVEILSEYAPNVASAVEAMDVVTPLDLEREYSLTGGSIFQGAMTLDQLVFMRPVFGSANYATPIKGLYLCGAATHPGGGVMGACGHNAAKRILKDMRRR